MRPSSPMSLGDHYHEHESELSFRSPGQHRSTDKAGYSTRSPSTVPGSLRAYMHHPAQSPSQRTLPADCSGMQHPTSRTPEHSAVAQLRKELTDERRKLQAITKANQQSMDKTAEYKERYRGLKSAMTDKEKQLDLAKRTIERLSGQCNAMEAGVATDKAYTRKLEAKLSASRSISDLHARCSQYKLKLRELAQELEEAESRTASVQEVADVRADEVGTLRQALQIKAAELSKQTGADIHSRLLYAVAKSREEGVALAVQLAECKERTRQAENSADDAHDESRALREQLEEAESQMQQVEQRLVDTAANCRRFEGNAEEIRSEVRSMQQQVRVLASEKGDLASQLHTEQTRSRQHLTQVATLEQQVANLERQRQQEGTSLRASSEHMQQEMQGHCTNLQAQLDAFQEMMERERQNAHSSVARERARTVAAERDAESACSQADARKRQLQHDLDDAHSEVQTLSDVNQRLQASLAETTKAHQAERLKRDNLHKQVLNLEASLSAVHSERSQSDTGLKSRMQELLSELQSTLQERGVYKAKWQELLSKHTSAQSATERLQKDLQQLQQSYADLQKVNHALESRLLGHHSPTAGDSPPKGNSVCNGPARQSYYSSPGAAANRAQQTEYKEDIRAWAEDVHSWSSTNNLDRVLAEHRGRASPGHEQAFEHAERPVDATEADSRSRAQLHGGVSSEDIMARLTRSPDGVAGSRQPGCQIPALVNQQQAWGCSPGSLLPQAHGYNKKVSSASASGLQSPPCEDQQDFDGPLPTEELKSALFGSVNPQPQQAADLGSRPGISHAAGPTAAASAASAGQLRQQVLRQLQAKQGNTTGTTGGHDSIAAHHQKAPKSFAGFARGQDVPHNARLWSMPVSPKLAADFSLHNNPLADDDSQLANLKAEGAEFGSTAVKRHVLLEAPNDAVLSLSELASMDTSQL